MPEQIDLNIASRFLSRIEEEESAITFQTFDDHKKRKSPELARILHGSFDEHCDELVWLNQQGAGIFFAVNATDGRGRSTSNIIKVRALFVDLDGSPLEPIFSAPLEPHMIIQSSEGKFHAYWTVEGIELREFTGIQKALAKRFNGDEKVCDLPRVMRLPGFLHQKSNPYLTHILHEHVRLPYPKEMLLSAFTINVDSNNAEKSASGIAHDPILKCLSEKRMLRGTLNGKSGAWHILCPWSHLHTTGDLGTHYFEANHNGYKGPAFHCFHSHCKDKTFKDFEHWLRNDTLIESKVKWNEPISLPEGLPSVASFEDHFLPEPLKKWILDVAERMQIPPDFSAASAVVILSSLIGRKLGVYPKQMDNWLVVPNLWGAVIGRPALLKSPAVSEMLKPLEILIQGAMLQHKEEMQSFEAHKMIAEAEKGALKDQLRRAAKKNQSLDDIIRERQINNPLLEPIQKRYKTEDGTVEKIGEILLQNPRGILVHRS